MTATLFSEFIERFSLSEVAILEEGVLTSSNLSDRDRRVFSTAAATSLFEEASASLMRVLILELHAANLKGHLSGESEEERLDDFRRKIMLPSFERHLGERYPALGKNLRHVLKVRRFAIELMISRFIVDRDEISCFFDLPCSDMCEVHYGLGDPHAGGHTVTRLDFSGGSIMYKPRAMGLDVKLNDFLKSVFEGDGGAKVPSVLDKSDYGWSSFVSHEYCVDGVELEDYHRNIGRWVAVFHLLRGSDIHCDNLIASRAIPWVVDPECLFAEVDKGADFGRGFAYTDASLMVSRSVVRIGILPFRSPLLAFRGLDLSVLGATAGQQPDMLAPRVADAGGEGIRVKGVKITLDAPKSMPSAASTTAPYWGHVVEGFTETNRRLSELDGRGELRSLLDGFSGCEVREIIRPTQIYAELKHMLWHPAALHDHEKARKEAMLVLDRGAEAPSLSLEEKIKEIDEVVARDIPVFRSRVDAGRVTTTLDAWRASDLDFQELIVRGTLSAGVMNLRDQEQEGIAPVRVLGESDLPDGADLDALRRKLAAQSVRRLLDLSVKARDSTRTWIGIAKSLNGWTVKPVELDFYGGLGGIVFALAGYAHEMTCGRVDPVDGLLSALDAGLAALREMEQLSAPARGGGFDGLGAQLWVWQLLHALSGKGMFLQYAFDCAENIVGKVDVDDFENDILAGEAGLIIPLLNLADLTGSNQWLDGAASVARRLDQSAIVDDRGARWKGGAFERPIGGMAHGASGIAWSLARLSVSKAGSVEDRKRWGNLGRQAFEFESSLFDGQCCAWSDLRSSKGSEYSNAWCHGGVGIGLVAADLYARTGSVAHLETMRLAARSALKHGWHKGVTLCHGSLGMRELIARSVKLDDQIDSGALCDGDRIILSEIDRLLNGRDKMNSWQFTPGLMTGLSGAVLGLCRMHPNCDLPTPLLMEVSPPPGC